MRELLLGAAVALLCTCTPPLEFRLDPSFGDEAAEGIVQAAKDWNELTNEAHQITFDGDAWYIEKTQPPGGFNGWTSRKRQRVLLAPNPIGVSWRALAKHEFGHALGLRHTCWAPGVLGESSTPSPCVAGRSVGVMDPINATGDFTEQDIAECRAVGACD